MAKVSIGADLGTASARAGMFDPQVTMLARAKRDLVVFGDNAGHVEQSSVQIWQAVCDAVGLVGADAADMAGIGVDPTCSLVVRGARGGAGDTSDPERGIIVWIDHRVLNQARRINATGHPVLSSVGGTISPEMETPKHLRLREKLSEIHGTAPNLFDLTGCLTWEAAAPPKRSSCRLTCAWTYLRHEARWDETYFRDIGLEGLVADRFARIGRKRLDTGTGLGNGRYAEAAAQMNVLPGLGGERGGARDATSCLAYVFATSSCTMTTTIEPSFVSGVRGPSCSARVPGMWLYRPAGKNACRQRRHQPDDLRLWLCRPPSALATVAGRCNGYPDRGNILPRNGAFGIGHARRCRDGHIPRSETSNGRLVQYRTEMPASDRPFAGPACQPIAGLFAQADAGARHQARRRDAVIMTSTINRQAGP